MRTANPTIRESNAKAPFRFEMADNAHSTNFHASTHQLEAAGQISLTNICHKMRNFAALLTCKMKIQKWMQSSKVFVVRPTYRGRDAIAKNTAPSRRLDENERCNCHQQSHGKDGKTPNGPTEKCPAGRFITPPFTASSQLRWGEIQGKCIGVDRATHSNSGSTATSTTSAPREGNVVLHVSAPTLLLKQQEQ